MLTYLSICSGIEAASVAWEPLGLSAVGFSEIAPFPRAVLTARFPKVPLHGDFVGLIPDPPAASILVGGPPCQAFSMAGLRGGISDPRGRLTLAFVELANAIDRKNDAQGLPPSIVVYENVPGILTDGGNAFGCFLAGLVGEDVPLVAAGGKWSHAGLVLGPQRNVAWRVLDAQHFGLPQRRKRVVLVASARKDLAVDEILFERCSPRQGVRADNEEGESTAPGAERGIAFGEGPNGEIAFVKAGRAQSDQHQETWVLGRVAPTLSVFDSGASRATTMIVLPDGSIRRLTMVEEERLQGFPDNWTAIPWRGKPASECPEGLRHETLANTMAVPMMRWLGKRLVAATERTK